MRHLIFVFCIVVILLTSASFSQAQEAENENPEPMLLVNEGDYDIVNILLIGVATENEFNPGLTDALMLVSINRTVGAVSIVSIPRDLWVYIPDYGMGKINQAYFFGETRDETRTGIELLEETVHYNLGVNVDYYARVNFTGFMNLIDEVGGIQISVDCAIRDWKLISPELDKQDANNYEMFTLPIGVHTLDAFTTLWYVRSRKTSTDIDRGRRQQDVLRALWRKIRASELLTIENLPTLWDTATQTIETDLAFGDVVTMAPLAVAIDTSDIEYYTFRLKHEVNNGYSDAGQAILEPQYDAIHGLMQQVVLPPTISRVDAQRPTIAVINASGVPGLATIAADRLELEGFQTFVVNEWSVPREFNKIVDYTGEEKGNPIGNIQKIMHVTPEGIEISPESNRDYDYRLYIGSQYQFWTCTRPVIQPDVEVTPEPNSTAGN